MKKIYLQNPGEKEQLLFDPAQGLLVDEPVLTREAGTAGTLKFDVFREHSAFEQIHPLTTFFIVKEDGKEIFRGRNKSSEEDFYSTGHISCEGDLAFLYDSILRPYEHKGGIEEFLQMVLDNHNSQVEERKQFRLGMVTVADENDYISRSDSGYSHTIDVLRDKLADTHGGYLRTRKEGGIYYLDYVEDYGGTNAQKIRFGENLLDLTKYVDATSIITALIPTGANIQKNGTAEQLRISDVNDGLDYVYDPAAVLKYGWIWAEKNWKDVTVASNLLKKAREYIKSASVLPLTMQLNAVDLVHAGVKVQSFQIGYWTDVISEQNGVQGSYLLTKMENHLASPENDTIVLGGNVTSLTSGNVNNKRVTAKQIQSAASSAAAGIDLRVMTKEELESILI